MRTSLKERAIVALLAIVAILAIGGCAGSNNRLQPGGVYAPVTTNEVGQVIATTQPDYAFFVIDSTFELAVSSIDTAFRIERDNRALLWKISPEIKHTLDGIRPQASAAKKRYAQARKVYKASPVPANLDVLRTALLKIQRLTATAAAALPADTTLKP